MNVCQVTPVYLPANLTGSGKYVQYLSEGLTSKGHRVTVRTSTALSGEAFYNPFSRKFCRKRMEIINEVYVYRHKIHHFLGSSYFILHRFMNKLLPRSFDEIIEILSTGPLISGLSTQFAESSYDVTHASPFPLVPVWLAYQAAKKAKIPFICTPFYHFGVSGQNFKFFRCYRNRHFQSILTNADAIIACTNLEKKTLIKQGALGNRIHVIPMGVHPDLWRDISGARFRVRYGLRKEKIALYAGIKAYNKGAIHLLQAMNIIEKVRKDVILIAIGVSTREWEREKKKHPGLKILDFEYKDGQEKSDIFDACDVYAMPSRSDAFGIVFLEAWLCGKPVIGARAGALPEVIREGIDGYLVDFGNVDDLTQKILFLLDNPDISREFGKAGKEKTLNNFTWKQVVKKTEDVYQSVLA